MDLHKLWISTILFSVLHSGGLAQGLPLPYSTGFDNAAEQAGWQEFRTGYLSLYNWNMTGSSISHGYNVGGAPTDTVVDWFVSPALHFHSPATIALKVRSHGFSAPAPDNLEVWFGTGDPDPTIGDYVLLSGLSDIQPMGEWIDTTVAVPFVAENAHIAFRYKTIGAAWMTYAIDEVVITPLSGLGMADNAYLRSAPAMRAYPNPFVSGTTIEMDGPVQNAHLELHDARGQLAGVVAVVNGPLVELPRAGLAAGHYVVRLIQHGHEVSHLKLTIVDR